MFLKVLLQLLLFLVYLVLLLLGKLSYAVFEFGGFIFDYVLFLLDLVEKLFVCFDDLLQGFNTPVMSLLSDPLFVTWAFI